MSFNTTAAACQNVMNASIAVDAISTRGAPLGAAASIRDLMISSFIGVGPTVRIVSVHRFAAASSQPAGPPTLHPYDLMSEFSQSRRQSLIAGSPPGTLDGHHYERSWAE